jgi:hypothetical protein
MSSAESGPQRGGLSRIPFTVEAEKQIESLSYWLKILGWLSIVAGILGLLNLLTSGRNFGHVFNAILQVIIGVWSLQAAEAFKKVATTDEADQAYLVEGFSKLRGIFLVQGVLILVGLAFVVAVFLFVLSFGTNLR